MPSKPIEVILRRSFVKKRFTLSSLEILSFYPLIAKNGIYQIDRPGEEAEYEASLSLICMVCSSNLQQENRLKYFVTPLWPLFCWKRNLLALLTDGWRQMAWTCCQAGLHQVIWLGDIHYWVWQVKLIQQDRGQISYRPTGKSVGLKWI